MSDLQYTTDINCSEFKKKNNYCCGNPKVIHDYINDCNLPKRTNKQKFEKLFYTIMANKSFVFNVMRARKMARDYYNKRKNFCIVFDMNKVKCGSGKLSLYLNYPDCNTNELHNTNDFNSKTFLMRVVPLLPSIWGCYSKHFNALSSWNNYTKEKGTPYPKVPPFCNYGKIALSENEKILVDYMNIAGFFTDLFSSLNFSVSNFNQRRNYCKVFNVPKLLDTDCVGYKIRLNGEELRMLQCLYLRNTPYYYNKIQSKLPYNSSTCDCSGNN